MKIYFMKNDSYMQAYLSQLQDNAQIAEIDKQQLLFQESIRKIDKFTKLPDNIIMQKIYPGYHKLSHKKQQLICEDIIKQGFFGNAWNKIKSGAKTAVNKVKEVGSKLVPQWIKDCFNKAKQFFNSFVSLFASLGNIFKFAIAHKNDQAPKQSNLTTQSIQLIMQEEQKLAEQTKSLTNELKEKSDAIDSKYSFIAKISATPKKWGENISNTFIMPVIKTMNGGSVWDLVKSLIEKIKNWIKDKVTGFFKKMITSITSFFGFNTKNQQKHENDNDMQEAQKKSDDTKNTSDNNKKLQKDLKDKESNLNISKKTVQKKTDNDADESSEDDEDESKPQNNTHQVQNEEDKQINEAIDRELTLLGRTLNNIIKQQAIKCVSLYGTTPGNYYLGKPVSSQKDLVFEDTTLKFHTNNNNIICEQVDNNSNEIIFECYNKLNKRKVITQSATTMILLAPFGILLLFLIIKSVSLLLKTIVSHMTTWVLDLVLTPLTGVPGIGKLIEKFIVDPLLNMSQKACNAWLMVGGVGIILTGLGAASAVSDAFTDQNQQEAKKQLSAFEKASKADIKQEQNKIKSQKAKTDDELKLKNAKLALLNKYLINAKA